MTKQSKNRAKKRSPKNLKNRKPLSLKQKLHKESKIVKADNLQWKPVDVPDNLDDYEGFFGLEELEGVGVEVVNGQPQFSIKNEDGIYEEDGTAKNIHASDEDDGEEFKGFDDLPTTDKKEKQAKPEKNTKSKKAIEIDSSLQSLGFENLINEIPEEFELPHWQFSEKGCSLNPFILSALFSAGYESPTPIQKKAIPLALEGKDVIGKAITGSGKTLAYGIPLLEKFLSREVSLKKDSAASPVGIIFTPTRELAQQVVDHLNQIAKHSPLSDNGIVSLTGGLSIQKQERLLSKGPGIIVATPGRFIEHLEKDAMLLKRLAQTETVVLDEADRLLQDGHFEDFERILDLLNKNREKQKEKRKWQTLVFSATFSRNLFGKLDNNRKARDSIPSGVIDNDEIVELLKEKLQFKDSKPSIIDANPKHLVNNKITEALMECGPSERDLYLYYFLLMYPGSTLIFTNSIDSVKRLVQFLNALKIPAFSISSSMIQKQRLRALERFRASTAENDVSVLVASDVAARGLDIPNIDHVAHYHLPRTADTYIHRSGRTGRAGREGVSVLLCSPQEASGPLKKLRRLVSSSRKINDSQDVKHLPIEMNIITQLKPRVNIASQLAASVMSSVSASNEKSWMKGAAEDLGLDSDMEDEIFNDKILSKSKKKREIKILSKDDQKTMRHELNELLSIPIRQNFRRSYLTSGLSNLAHQVVVGETRKDILGLKDEKALEKLNVGKKKKSKVNIK